MTTGLFMLQAQVSVTVTREEYHQQVLGRYPITDSGYRTTAELTWCTIGAGKYRGQRGVEIRLGGERAGELTYAMSQRYGAMLELVAERGYRVGCEAYVFLGKRGVELELRLPRENSEIVFPVLSVPVQVGRVGTASAPTGGTPKNGLQKPGLIAAGVAGAVLLIAIISSQAAESPSADSGPVANVTTSSSTASSRVTSPPVTTTTTTTTTTSLAPPPPPLPPAPAANAPASPAKTSKTTKPAPPPKNTPAPPAPPVSKCNPNYSGCVPVASDVDCEGGSGNGPAYVSGPIQVIGKDVYGLDNDKDGTACE
jgi:hypothetical protein